ncbi:MAG TPA: hypothetical protein VJ044_09935 [Candidatus Hodarchaeales archaeon]|nr:hypothetical protein [Candidatus Hodarchaeales archaeon]
MAVPTLAIKLALVDFSEDVEGHSCMLLGAPLRLNYFSLIGCDICVREVSIVGAKVKYQIWILSSAFMHSFELHLKGTKCVIMVIDWSKPTDFHDIGSFMGALSRANGNPSMPILLLSINADRNNSENWITDIGVYDLVRLSCVENGLDFNQVHLLNVHMPSDFDYTQILRWLAVNILLDKRKLGDEVEIPTPLSTLGGLSKITPRSVSPNMFNSPHTNAFICVSDRKRGLADDLAGWVLCEKCRRFLCHDCYEFFASKDYISCPGSAFGPWHRISPLVAKA